MPVPPHDKPQPQAPPRPEVEVSFVIPCLNEEATIARCVAAALRCLAEHGVRGEVIVADNASTDGTAEAARKAGACIIEAPRRGLGAAVAAGVAAARGRFIIMGDADLQHDFSQCFPFIQKLREGADLVMGSRLRGRIMPGAMRPLSRYVGNPLLSLIGRVLFRAPVSDFHCGLRGFRREPFLALNLRTTGFEFTTEHVARSALRGLRIDEVPITVHPSARPGPPHLRPFNDGWRTLRFMLLLSPRWTLAVPGLLLMLAGGVMAALVARGPLTLAPGIVLDIHTLVLGCALMIVGWTACTVGAAARAFAAAHELGPPPPLARRIMRHFTLERGLAAGALLLAIGLVLVGRLAYEALTVRLRPEDVFQTLRPMVIGSTLIALGFQTMLMSFFCGMLAIPHAPGSAPLNPNLSGLDPSDPSSPSLNPSSPNLRQFERPGRVAAISQLPGAQPPESAGTVPSREAATEHPEKTSEDRARPPRQSQDPLG